MRYKMRRKANRIAEYNWIIITIRKHIVTQEALSGTCKGIRIDEPTDGRVVISALEVVEPGFSGVTVAALVFTEILYHISGIVARRKLASARQILGAGFGHCADFGGRMFHSARSVRSLRRRRNPDRTSLFCPDGERELISGVAVLRLLRSSTDPVPEEIQ